MNIHIAPVGKELGHVRVAFNKMQGFDRLYLITSKKYEANAEQLGKELEGFGVKTSIMNIDPFEEGALNNILDIMLKIIKENRSHQIFINISGGTNLMGAAALCAAYFTQVKAYYVLDSRKAEEGANLIVELPIPKVSYANSLTPTQKEILQKIAELTSKAPIKNIRKFAESLGWSQQRIKPHIDSLKEMRLISIDQEEKEHTVTLTQEGKIILELL